MKGRTVLELTFLEQGVIIIQLVKHILTMRVICPHCWSVVEMHGLFCEYYIENEDYAQTIADTRHYYTHYGKSKEPKALKGNDLLEAIYILRVLLEYHVCLMLGIDRRDAIAQELRTHHEWRQLSEMQAKESFAKE